MKRAIQNFIIFVIVFSFLFFSCSQKGNDNDGHEFNGYYSGRNLDRVAFPVGGIGAGMFCLEGTGAISHMSVRNHPEVFNEPCMFAAISVKGIVNGTKVLEGMVPDRKKFGTPNSGNGSPGASYGFPRFENARFLARFPFAIIELQDEDIPLEVQLTGWSPFIPTDADNSSLPAGALEYSFKNTGTKQLEAVFSYSSVNFMNQPNGKATINPLTGGFILSESGAKDKPETRVWTGIEYQVASHLMMMGEVEKGLEIVRTCRNRYDGRIRNPFNEYECGNWYARAMSSYALLQGLTGLRYDALTRTLFIDSRIGDFTCFISTETGFGNSGLENGEPL